VIGCIVDDYRKSSHERADSIHRAAHGVEQSSTGSLTTAAAIAASSAI
jgi:hypothetical protein